MSPKPSILLAAAAVTITATAVWWEQRPVTVPPATWKGVMAEAEAGNYRIMTTTELADRYRRDSAELLLVDTRQPWEYRTGHIDGALNFPMEPGRWARWRRAGALRAFLGPDKERSIVFY